MLRGLLLLCTDAGLGADSMPGVGAGSGQDLNMADMAGVNIYWLFLRERQSTC